MWYFPEHSVPAYYYSFFEGADFIDVDINPTSDGHFVIFHDPIVTKNHVDGLTIENGFDPEMMNQDYHKDHATGMVYPPKHGWFIKDCTLK